MKQAYKIFIFSALLSSMTLMANMHAIAGPLWKADITVSAMTDSNRLILGQAGDATDGFENSYEGRALLSGNLMAYFYHPEWGVDTAYFWSDIKDATLPKEWVFYINSQYADKDITLKWNLKAPDTLKVYIVDDTLGTVVNMRENSSYIYRNTSTAARKFTVHASVEM